MQPDVSVIVAAYNAESSIARAIDSALAQRGVAVEVVVVDDCSRDGTAQRARRFPQDTVKVIALDRNRGPGGARNVAVKAATGRWIAVLDSDDTMQPDRLRRMISRAETSDAQIAVDNIEVIRDAEAPETMFSPQFLAARPELDLAEFISANVMFEEAFSLGYMKPVLDRSFVQRHGLLYDEALRIGEDYMLMVSALAKGGRCVVEPLAGYRYHVRAGSISRVLELHHVRAMLKADAAFLERHELEPQALAAQRRRTSSLERAASFLTLVQHLKDREPFKAAAAALRDPAALPLLRMPIAARFRRLARLAQGKPAQARW